MSDKTAASIVDQPGAIVRQVSIALVLAAGVFLCLILPAEYDVDPTGVGEFLGIKGMSSAEKLILVENPAADDSAVGDSKFHMPAVPPLQFLTAEIELEPFGQAEYKFTMKTGESLGYTWSTNEGTVYADLHGHRMVDGSELLVEYLKSDAVAADSGKITAPFAGEHGWYFLNLGKNKQIITLKVSGRFSAQQLIDLGSQLP